MDTIDSMHVGILYGDPQQAAGFYQEQQQPEDCVEMSAADIIEQVTGQNVSESDITNEATHLTSSGSPVPAALYDPAQGTVFSDAPTLLAAYGVQSTYTDDAQFQAGGQPTGLDALENQLAAGHDAIVSVDAETIWSALGLPAGTDHGLPDHAVVVTGVDTSNGVVYVNDSGVTGGAAEAVPIAAFEQAWAASGHAMVTTGGSTVTATTDPLNAPAPSWATPSTSTDIFGGTADPTADYWFPHDDSRFIAAGGAALAAGLVASLLHPRTRAVTRTAIGRVRARRS